MRNGRVLLVGGVAGLVLAHSLAYAIVIPDSRDRAAQLLVSGHGYWPLAVGVAIVSFLVALGASAVRGFSAGTGASRSTASRSGARLSLTAWQVGLFVTMEVSERLCSGVDPSGLIGQPEFVAGVLIQIAVAHALERVLHGVAVAVEHLVRRGRRPSGQARPVSSCHLPKPRSIANWIGQTSPSRGPPALALC